MGQHESHVTEVDLFADYSSSIADVVAHHGVQYYQYADDTQLHLVMRTDNTPAGLYTDLEMVY